MGPGRVAVDVAVQSGVAPVQSLQPGQRWARVRREHPSHSTKGIGAIPPARLQKSASVGCDSGPRSGCFPAERGDFPRLVPPAYDVTMAKARASARFQRRTGRRVLWLAIGIVAGLVLGFAYGLTKPRPRD